jgi:hypothetical protein
MPAGSVFSSQPITPEQIAWVMGHFGAEQNYYGDWCVPTADHMEVAVVNSSKNLGGMPPTMLDPVGQLLRSRPVTALSVVSLQAYPPVTWAIVNLFAKWWPCCWHDHTTNPPIPLWPQQRQ